MTKNTVDSKKEVKDIGNAKEGHQNTPYKTRIISKRVTSMNLISVNYGVVKLL